MEISRKMVAPSIPFPNVKKGWPGDLVTFLIPATAAITFSFLGEIYGSDVAVVVALPFLLLVRGKRLLEKFPRTILSLGLLWLTSQILTDMIVGTIFEDYSRRWANITLFLIGFSAIYLLLIVSRRRLLLFAAGIIVGILIRGIVLPDAYAIGLPWKFGYGVSLMWIAPLIGIYLTQRFSTGRLMVIAIMIAAGFFYALMGARSLGGFCVMAGATILGQNILAGFRHRQPSSFTLALVIAGMLLFALLPLQLWVYAAGSGMLGNTEQAKYQQQAQGGGGLFEIIQNGRGELSVSTRAIADSPIIGHGSWAKNREYVINAFAKARNAGIRLPESGLRADLIPTHSHLFGSWVESGFAGGLFWIVVLTFTVKAILALLKQRDPYTPLLAIALLLLCWDIIFSPFSGDRRAIAPFLIICCHYILTASKPTSLATPHDISGPVQEAGLSEQRLSNHPSSL